MMAGVCNFKQFPEEGLRVVKSLPLSLLFQLYTCVPELQWRGHVPAEEEGDGTSDRATGSTAIGEPDTGPEKQRRGTCRSIHVLSGCHCMYLLASTCTCIYYVIVIKFSDVFQN